MQVFLYNVQWRAENTQHHKANSVHTYLKGNATMKLKPIRWVGSMLRNCTCC